jgi:serine/threonine protein kinase
MALPHQKTVRRAEPLGIPADAGEYREELLGTTLLDRYEVFEINRGGFGLVLGVHDSRTGEDLAVKTPRPENRHQSLSVEEFKSEVGFWLKLDPHPNIVTARSVESVFDCPALFMDYVRADPFKTVRDWLTAGGMNREAAFGIMHQVATGKEFANRKGEIAHLDLKPENLMVDRNGTCKVTDFGLARRVQVVRGSYSRTSSATWAYAAPEILGGQVGDQRSDIFSYGLIFYELLTGGLPFPFDISRDSHAAYQQLKDFHGGCGIAKVTSDLYYHDLPGPHGHEFGVILSSCLGHHQDEREESFSSLLGSLERGLGLQHPSYTGGEAGAAEGPLQRAIGLRQIGRYSDALAILNRLLSHEPDRADVWQEAVLTLRASGDETTAAQFEIRARALGAPTRPGKDVR